MRNLGFAAGVAAALIGGGLIGTFADFGDLRRAAVLPVLVRSDDPAGVQPNAEDFTGFPRPRPPSTGGLAFVIDTKQGERPSAGSGSPYRSTAAPETSTCRMPAATRGEQVILFGAYEGDAISTVALADRNMETGVMEIEIEPGMRPLYVILSSYGSTIWRFSGAVDRVTRVVLVASPTHPPASRTPPDPYANRLRSSASASAATRRASIPRQPRQGRAVYAGVVGLEPNRIKTVSPEDCFGYFYEVNSISTTRITSVVRRAMGRQPDIVAGSYSLAALRLPSGMGAKGPRREPPAPRGFDPGFWSEAVRFSSAGLTALNPADVISTVPVLPYDVLPNQMGLSQLVGAGDLQRLSDGVKIVRPVPRFPAELNGAHSTAFLLAAGVPMPEGSPGHSCVIREETGEPVSDSPMCR